MRLVDNPQLHIPYFTFESLEKPGFFVSAFTFRRYRTEEGTRGCFQPLLRSHSDPAEVDRCTQMLVRQFRTDTDHLVPSAQQHTSHIRLVVPEDLGPEESRVPFEQVDGLITDMPGVMLQTFGADCPSVYLADPVHKAIGLCHSGRKGTQQHIAAVMLREMERAFGTSPSDVLAAISPGICAECYEVGDDVAFEFIRAYTGSAAMSAEDLPHHKTARQILKVLDGRYHIDLFRAITLSLEAAGVPASRVEQSELCTRCRSDLFYSLRAEGRISNENSALFMIRDSDRSRNRFSD